MKYVKACVKVSNDRYTDLFKCPNGLKQGSQLSPFLFIFFISDLEKDLRETGGCGISIGVVEIFHLLFADDLILIADSVRQLQKKLDTLYKYCMKWKLIVNLKKTKIIVFRRGGKLTKFEKWRYGDKSINVVNSYRGTFALIQILETRSIASKTAMMTAECQSLIRHSPSRRGL